jgi:hypothetical protein
LAVLLAVLLAACERVIDLSRKGTDASTAGDIGLPGDGGTDGVPGDGGLDDGGGSPD